jgi:hypothetical protein
MARTDAEKAQDYTAMGHSVELINAVIAGSQMADEDASEDMAATTKAISDGKAYKAS